MTGEDAEEKGSGWKKFFKNHGNMVALFGAAVILLAFGAVIVYLWFVGEAQSSGLVPGTLGLWTMGHLVTFILHLIFWELLFIGIPAGIGAAAGWLWWKRLPEGERKEYQFSKKRSRTSRGGSGISMLFFIAFCIKVYVDGNWNTAIGTWSVDYVARSIVTILVWGLIIVGIPAAIGGIWWIRREMSRTP